MAFVLLWKFAGLSALAFAFIVLVLLLIMRNKRRK